AFTKGAAGKPGLWLSPDPKAKPLTGGQVFDVAGRTLAGTAGWEGDEPDYARDGWGIDQIAGPPAGFRVPKGDYTYPNTLSLLDNEIATARALLPRAPGLKGPVLAVAHTNRLSAETFVTLFDIESGKPFRRLSGHLQSVAWLAFSGSRPLLATAAEDQTVC